MKAAADVVVNTADAEADSVVCTNLTELLHAGAQIGAPQRVRSRPNCGNFGAPLTSAIENVEASCRCCSAAWSSMLASI